MDQAGLGIIEAIASANQLAVLTKSVEALKGLADGDKPIELFDYYSSSTNSWNFQLGSVQLGTTGTLAVAMGAFHFNSDTRRRKFLFVSWGQKQVQFWTSAQKMTLNKERYEPLRELIKEKLGAKSMDFVAALDL